MVQVLVVLVPKGGPFRPGLASGIQLKKEGQGIIQDFFWVSYTFPISSVRNRILFLLLLVDCSVEKGCVGISFTQPSDSGFGHPELFLKLQELIIFLSQLLFQILEGSTVVKPVIFL